MRQIKEHEGCPTAAPGPVRWAALVFQTRPQRDARIVATVQDQDRAAPDFPFVSGAATAWTPMPPRFVAAHGQSEPRTVGV
jgi:hypothetical protein